MSEPRETQKCESRGKRQGLRVKVMNQERREKHGREGGENSRRCWVTCYSPTGQTSGPGILGRGLGMKES